MDAVRGDVLTLARLKRGDVIMEEGSRGGLQWRTESYLDVLLGVGTITPAQASLGRSYWLLRESAFGFLGAKGSRIFADCTGDDTQAEPEPDYAEEGMNYELYMALGSRLLPIYRSILSAACSQVGHPSQRMLVHQQFNESAIMSAFERLERVFDDAYSEALNKHRKPFAHADS